MCWLVMDWNAQGSTVFGAKLSLISSESIHERPHVDVLRLLIKNAYNPQRASTTVHGVQKQHLQSRCSYPSLS